MEVEVVLEILNRIRHERLIGQENDCTVRKSRRRYLVGSLRLKDLGWEGIQRKSFRRKYGLGVLLGRLRGTTS